MSEDSLEDARVRENTPSTGVVACGKTGLMQR